MSIKAQVIADSQYGENRLTTMLLTFPRIILPEVLTHRVFSRNTSSSRAVPFEKMVKQVQENPFVPIKWMKAHKGMQGTQFFGEEESCKDAWYEIDKGFGHSCYQGVYAHEYLTQDWKEVAYDVCSNAMFLHNLGVSKQICNRLLEPFMWTEMILSGTEFDNFFQLRLNPAAEIHMQELARCMKEARDGSVPKILKEGEWHIPMGTEKEIATARIARVSYLNFEGKDDRDADIKLFNKLKEEGHMSPFEHCAQAKEGWSQGNFKGFKQLRWFIENKEDYANN